METPAIALPKGDRKRHLAEHVSIAQLAGMVSQGTLQLPTASANGTELQARPYITRGVRFDVPTGGSISYGFAKSGQTLAAPPTYTVTRNTAGTFDEPLAGDDAIYVTAITGTVVFRWIG